MKSTKRVLITGLILTFLFCSKNYEGDLQSFSLNGMWLYHEGTSAEWSRTFFNDTSWARISLPAVLKSSVGSGSGNPTCYRRHFVLMGHFEERVVYLYLGRNADSMNVYLNGKLVGHRGNVSPHFGNIHRQKAIFEIDPADLHFGRENVLAVDVFGGEAADSLFGKHPGIYSRLGFLRMSGFRVSTCPYKIERNIHARLEDFSKEWQRGDSLKMASYLGANIEKRNSAAGELLSELLSERLRFQSANIELERPGFYCEKGDSVVLVLGDWYIRSEDRPVHRLAFQWRFQKLGGKWYIMGSL